MNKDMKTKKEFEAPEIEIIMLEQCSVIATSGENYEYEQVEEKDSDQITIRI